MDLIKYLVLPIFACSWICTIFYKKYAINRGIISSPNYRTLHELPVPRGGGIIFSLLLTMSIFLLWFNFILSDNLFLVLGVGGFMAILFGFIDDIKNIKASIKLIIQILLAFWVVYFFYMDGLLIIKWIPIYLSIPFLIFLIVWLLNAYNFIDGVDGLAASMTIFISLTLALVLFFTENIDYLTTLFILLAGVVGGFIVFNWPPASIFMGDAGSVYLGYIFGSLFLYTTLNGYISIWVWLTVSAYFLADTTITQLIRVIFVRKWFLPHRSHAYQNFARISDSHAKVTIGITVYNVIWILPLTLFAAFIPEWGFIFSILALIPATLFSFRYGPLFSSS